MGGTFGRVLSGIATGGLSEVGRAAFPRPDTRNQEELAATQAQIAMQLFGETQGLRSELFGSAATEGSPATPGQLGTFLSSGELPTALDFDRSGAVRDTLEQQFANAREGIISGTPARGGQLNDLLAESEFRRALGIGQAEFAQQEQENDLSAQLFSQILGVSTGIPQTSLAGLGSASASFGNISAIQQQASAQQGQALGSAAALAAKFASGGLG